MFTPLTLSIFRGVLSPDRLAEQRIGPRQLVRAAQQLDYLPAEAEALHERLNEWLSPWQIRLPVITAGQLSSAADCPPVSRSSWLALFRQSEMEYVVSVSYTALPAAPLAVFYASVLNAEARWLRASLKRCLSSLPGLPQARELVCRVLDEVYATGALVGDVSADAADAWLRLLLKGAMASLYLELTADFSGLLESADYLDYAALLSTPAYLLTDPLNPALSRQQARVHQTHLKVNKAFRLYIIKAREFKRNTTLCEVRSLYAELLLLWQWVSFDEAARSCLLSSLCLLENWVYLASCPGDLDNLPSCDLLCDPQWSLRQMQRLYDRYYSGHYLTSEGRAAVRCLDLYLQEVGLLFLGDSEVPTGSIPRRLKRQLQKQYAYYTQNYAATYRPLQPDKGLVPVAAPLEVSEPDDRQVHRLLHFFCEKRDKQGNLLLQPDEVTRLEHLFLDFLRGKRPEKAPKKLTIPKDFNSIFYGFFFYYHKKCGGDKVLYADFLIGVFAVDVTADVLVSNYTRSIEAYVKYAGVAA